MGVLPSFGTSGDGLGNTMMQSFWTLMRIQLLYRGVDEPHQTSERDHLLQPGVLATSPSALTIRARSDPDFSHTQRTIGTTGIRRR